MAWTITPDIEGCCERLEIVEQDSGVPVATLPAGATQTLVRCELLPSQQGTLCLVCVAPSGERRTLGCCAYECTEPPPCTAELRCEPTTDGFAVEWTLSRESCCEELEIRDRDTGAVVAVLNESEGRVEVPCDVVPGVRGTLCLVCVSPEGLRRPVACCAYACPENACAGDLACRATANGLEFQWSVTPDASACCDRFEIRDSAYGTTLWTGSSGLTSTTLPWAILSGGTACLVCVTFDGIVRVVGCCQYVVPNDECSADVVCRETSVGIEIAWSISPSLEECCQELLLVDTATQVVLASPAVGESVAEIPCDALPASQGEICLVCVDGNGVRRALACCVYECSHSRVTCRPDGDSVLVEWSVPPPLAARCQGFYITSTDPLAIIILAKADDRALSISCGQLWPRAEIVVTCVLDGASVRLGSCEYDCDFTDCTGAARGLVPGDINVDGRVNIADAVLLLNWLFGRGGELLPECLQDPLGDTRRALFDWNGDDSVNIADAVAELLFLFSGGLPHASGKDCTCVLATTCFETCTP